VPFPLAVALCLPAVGPGRQGQAAARAESWAILFVSDRDSTDAEVIDDVYETNNNTSASDPPGDIIPDWAPLPAPLRHRHR